MQIGNERMLSFIECSIQNSSQHYSSKIKLGHKKTLSLFAKCRAESKTKVDLVLDGFVGGELAEEGGVFLLPGPQLLLELLHQYTVSTLHVHILHKYIINI